MKGIILFLFLLPLISSLTIILNCPKEVFLEEEFECEIFFKNNYLSHDVKLNIIGEEKTINQIWEGNYWSRSDWYAKELINGQKTIVRLKITKNFIGIAKGFFKVRSSKDNKIVHEETFEIELKEKPVFYKNLSLTTKKDIVLNSKDIKTQKSVFLQDKDFLFYFGIVFLAMVSGILYFVKIKNGRRKFEQDTFGNYY